MSALDVKQAKQALSWRLAQWGVTSEVETKAASFIDDLVGKGWQMSPDRESRPRPPRAGEACQTCGRGIHEPDAICDDPTRQAPSIGNVSEPVAHLRALRDEATAELCSHGTRRDHCADHQHAETEPTEEPAS